jgi:hypothetical protein
MKKLLITATIFLSSCGTLMNGSNQKVLIQSDPFGARVIIDDQDYGKTPVDINLPRQKRLVGRLVKDGFEEDGFVIHSNASKWSTWGNFTFMSLASPIFIGVDILTGSYWNYEKDEIFILLEKES